MAEDGQVRIKVNFETNEIDKDIQKLQDKLAKQNETLARQSIIVERLTTRYADLYEKAKQTATPNIESEKILVEINKLEGKYKELQNLYNQAKLEPEIDQNKINEILSNLEIVDKKLIELRRKHQETQFSTDMQNKFKLLGQQIDVAVQKEDRLKNEVKATETEIDKLSNKRIDGLKNSVDKVKNSFESLGNKLKETQNNITNYAKNGVGNAFSSVGNTISSLGKKILNLGASAFVFNVISSGFHKMANSIKNVIAHDNQLSNSLAQVKANLATAFYPIYQAVLPAIQSLGRALSWVTGQIASFMAMITGTSLKLNQQGAKGLVAQTEGIADQTKQLNKQAKGYDKVAKSAKKAQGQLASFDKIEVLKIDKQAETPKINDSSTSGGAGKNVGGGAISSMLQGLQNNTPQLLDSIAQAFERLKKPFENMDLSRLTQEFDNLWQILQRFGGKIGEGLWWFYENVLAPLTTWTISEVLPRFFSVLASILEFLEPILDQVGEDLKWLWDNFLEPVAEWTGSLITQFLDKLAEVIKNLGDKIKNNKPLLEFISAFLIGLGTAGVVMGLVKLGTALWGIVKATWAWTVALLANPITWVVIGIAALVAGLILLAKHLENNKEATKKFQEILDSFKKTAETSLNVVKTIWNDLTETIKKTWEKHIQPTLENIKKKFNEVFEEKIKPNLEKIAKTTSKIINKIMILVGKLWDKIKPFVDWIIENIGDTVATTIETVFNTISDVVGDICEFMSNLWDTADKFLGFIIDLINGDWDKAWDSAGEVIKSMAKVGKSALNTICSAINGFINLLIGGINLAIRALNRIHIDLPDWMGGHHFGLNIPEIPKGWGNIPKLAKGAVLEGGHPFLAMLNEQPRGQTNIETPLSTMIEAFKQANRQSNPNIVVEASGDFAPFIRMLNFKLKEEDARVGQSFVMGDVWV